MRKSTSILLATLAMGTFIASGLVFATDPVPPTSLDFRNTDTGEPLDLSNSQPEGRSTPAVKKFLQSGVDPYIEDKSCLPKGEVSFLEACSGCHGQIGEGKIGPGLNDNYWTYPKNVTDKGLFETIYGGARSQMGPHNDLPLDEILKIMAWVRHLYKDDVKDASWLTAEQKKAYRPYKIGETFAANAPGMCAAENKKSAETKK
jgi:cytochrome c-L